LPIAEEKAFSRDRFLNSLDEATKSEARAGGRAFLATVVDLECWSGAHQRFAKEEQRTG